VQVCGGVDVLLRQGWVYMCMCVCPCVCALADRVQGVLGAHAAAMSLPVRFTLGLFGKAGSW